jgi:hypothetical protein
VDLGFLIVMEMASVNVLASVSDLNAIKPHFVKKWVIVAVPVIPTIYLVVSADANGCPQGHIGVLAHVGLILVRAIQMTFAVLAVAMAVRACQQFIVHSGVDPQWICLNSFLAIIRCLAGGFGNTHVMANFNHQILNQT